MSLEHNTSLDHHTPLGRITLLRHGETAWSKSGQHTGRTDIPLTPAGEDAARAVAGHLPTNPALVLVSPLSRAQETAQLAGLTDLVTDADLLEWDYGDWEGLTTPQIRQSLSDPSWLIWDHEIPNGEQLDEVRARVQRVIDRCMPYVQEGQDVILAAHGHVLRILTATWLGLAPIDGRLFALEPARISSLGFEHEQRVITEWNALR